MSEARKRFLDVCEQHKTRVADNFERIIELAHRIVEAENVGFVLYPESVESAINRILATGNIDNRSESNETK